jgi:hypothetical protein
MHTRLIANTTSLSTRSQAYQLNLKFAQSLSLQKQTLVWDEGYLHGSETAERRLRTSPSEFCLRLSRSGSCSSCMESACLFVCPVLATRGPARGWADLSSFPSSEISTCSSLPAAVAGGRALCERRADGCCTPILERRISLRQLFGSNVLSCNFSDQSGSGLVWYFRRWSLVKSFSSSIHFTTNLVSTPYF